MFFTFIHSKERHSEPCFKYNATALPSADLLVHTLGLKGTFCMVGRKPKKINFLTSCSCKNMLFTASFQSQSHVLWVFLKLFPCLKMLTEEANEEEGSPTRFLKTKALIVSLVRPYWLSYWRYFIASLATGKGYLTTTTAKLQTLPIMTHKQKTGITINIYFLINKLSFWNIVTHSTLS